MLNNVPNYIDGFSCVTSVRLEKVSSVILPYYVKCYVTEQFGEAVTLQSCLAVGCGRGYNYNRVHNVWYELPYSLRKYIK